MSFLVPLSQKYLSTWVRQAGYIESHNLILYCHVNMIGFSVLLNLLCQVKWLSPSSHWPPGSSVCTPGEVRGGKFHGVDLLQHSPSPSPSPGDPFPHQPRSLEPVTDTFHQNLPLRKTHSDLDTTLPAGVCGPYPPPMFFLFPLLLSCVPVVQMSLLLT